ncbi:MAG: 1-acyl-sn-glycerol-3-phosphate acyltransferase [Hyphomicrobiales bacterium]|nr:1-acyl-sn-glycerol-3-phosphate acyltransferase [Methylobacteriaceae bacterium]MCC2104620.1 1-acyl-sn-glycerol-3-phosphate acyltransferase [Hyphomicrobiales bacterium]MCC2107899.1 1-acyl-sn-glycerol-3-phosphate acyltransferase [Hyphomicrobiales bacterium]
MSDSRTISQRAPDSARRASIVVRSTIFNILFYVNLICLMVCGLPSVLMGRGPATFMARAWAKTSLWLLKHVCGTTLEFRGLDRMPPGGLVVAPKHQSMLETFALTLAVDNFSYVHKRELTWIPLFGWYLWAVDQISINRTSGSTALTQVANGVAAFLKLDRRILIFPEGTRRPVGAPPKYKYGVTHLYSSLNARVVPVALNTGLFWPRRSFLRNPGVAVIEFLPVIEPGLPREEFSQRLESAIENGTQALVEEALSVDPALGALVRDNERAPNTSHLA